MDFAPQQITAIDAVAAWLKEPGKQTFYLGGYAGTGKTTIAKHLASMQDKDVQFMAYTGKAASVLTKKGCPAQTIHSSIYSLIKPDDNKLRYLFDQLKDNPNDTELKSKFQEASRPRFELKYQEEFKDLGLIIVDEVSMVSEEIGRDLLSFGIKVLVLGDPGQLAPVGGEGFFTKNKPDYLLTDIHRQAQGNPIIGMATTVRFGGSLKKGNYGDSKVISRYDDDQEKFLAVDQIIVGTNNSRRNLNSLVRNARELYGEIPFENEKLICLRNDRERGFLNGTQWRVKKVKDEGTYISCDLQDWDNEAAPVKEETAIHPFSADLKLLLPYQRRRYQEFDYGYAITCHKSQGSQWGSILIKDESFIFKQDSAKWLYTALTRAENKVIVLV